MNVYTTDKFKGHYPIGTAAVAVAPSVKQAVKLLNKALAEEGLTDPVGVKDMKKVNTHIVSVDILCNGNYR